MQHCRVEVIGDFKCLTVVKLKPRPFRKPGLSFESNESSLRRVMSSYQKQNGLPRAFPR